MTKVLMISTDGKILDEGAPAHVRMTEYAALFEELHILILAKKTFHSSFFGVSEPMKIASNAFAYPTNSAAKIFYVRDGKKLGSKILDLIGKAGGTVVTAQDPFETGLVGAHLSSRSGAPLHVQIHTDLMSPYFKRSSILNRIRLFIAKKVLLKAKAVRTVSERIRRSLQDEKASVLPIWTDIEAIQQSPVPVGFKKATARFGKTVLMASRLTREKDLATAIKAFSKISAQYADAGLVVLGGGPELPRLASLAASLGIRERVIFEPWAERAEVISRMKTCDVFLSSSLYEGYGLSMLEAHVAGATLAATDAGIAPHLANDKCLAAPADARSLASALGNALSGSLKNKEYAYPYPSKRDYLEAYRKDIERALL